MPTDRQLDLLVKIYYTNDDDDDDRGNISKTKTNQIC